MSTLARDFGAEYPGGREAWQRAHLEHWLKIYVSPPEHAKVRGDVERAIASDPEMLEWASWPMMRTKGEWMRRQQEETCSL